MFLVEVPSNDTTRFLATQNLRDAVHEGLDYIAETDKTASGVFAPSQVGVGELNFALMEFANAAARLDRYKKVLFRKRTRAEAGLPVFFSGLSLQAAHSSIAEQDDLFHGVIGNCTEVGEQAEILITYLIDGKVDKINVFEEIGDNLWYLSRLIKYCGTTFLKVMRANIAKLRKRHGEAFNKEADGSRDLTAERQTLENGQ